jgi:hypothetical protein
MFHLFYGTHIRSVNEAIVSVNSQASPNPSERAKSLLEDYLQQNPWNQTTPELDKPIGEVSTKELGYHADKEGVIYCSLDTQRELDVAYMTRNSDRQTP